MNTYDHLKINSKAGDIIDFFVRMNNELLIVLNGFSLEANNDKLLLVVHLKTENMEDKIVSKKIEFMV